MSFWNNPENNSLKVLLIVLAVAGAGYFVFNNITSGNKGLVLNASKTFSTSNTLTTTASKGGLGGAIDSTTLQSTATSTGLTTDTSGSGLLIGLNTAYSDQTVPAGTMHYKVGSYKVTNLSSTESVHLTSFNLGFTTPNEVTNISVTLNGTAVGTTVATLPASASTGWISISSTLAPSATTTMDVYANITSVATNFRSNAIVTGVGSVSGATYYTWGGSSYSGQAIYIGTPVACVINSLTATPSSIVSGSSSTLAWNTTGCMTAALSGGSVSSVVLSGSISTGSLAATTTYVLTAHSAAGVLVTRSVTVAVVATGCANPSVTVVTPHGGETYLPTDTIHASWTSCGQPSSGIAEIAFVDQFSPHFNTYVSFPSPVPFSAGHYDFPVPIGLALGVYELRIFCATDPISDHYCIDMNHSEDLSDGIFMIGSPTTVGNITVSKNVAYPDQSIAPGTHHAKIGSFTITNPSSIGFVLTDIQAGFNSTAPSIPLADYANLQAYMNGAPVGPIFSAVSLTNVFPLGTVTISPGSTKTIDIYADLGSSMFFFYTTLKATATNSLLGIASTFGPANGQTVSVSGAPACSINSFYASPASISYGSTATAYWTTSNCTSVSIGGGPFVGGATTLTSLAPNGSNSNLGPLYNATTYTLTAYGASGTATASTTVTITPGTSGSLSLSKNSAYPDQSVMHGTFHKKIASYIAQNTSTTESINLNSIHIFPTLGTVPVSDLSNLGIYVNGAPAGSTFVAPTADNLVHPTTVLSAGSIATIDVYADLGSVAFGTVRVSANASGTGAISGMTYSAGTVSPVAGQTLSLY